MTKPKQDDFINGENVESQRAEKNVGVLKLVRFRKA